MGFTPVKKRNHPQRIDMDFEEALRMVSIERLKNGKDKRQKSIGRLTKGMTKHSEFKKILDDLALANMEDDIP